MNQKQLEEIIGKVVAGIYTDSPELHEKFGDRGKEKCREDNHHHFKQLQAAEKLGNEQAFIDYAHWLNGILTSRGIKTEHLTDNFESIIAVLKEYEAEKNSRYSEMLKSAIKSLSIGISVQ